MSEAATDPAAGDERLTFGPEVFGSTDARSNGWYGMLMLIATESCLFAYLLFSYYYMAMHYGRDWLPAELPGFKLSVPMTAVLFASSVVVWIGEQGIKKDRRWQCFFGLLGGIVLGCVFLGLEAKEWSEKPFSLDTGSYGSLFFTITGFHMAHVVGGVLLLSASLVWTGLGLFDRRRRGPISVASIYWHFVDVVWIAVFTTIYITPYLFQSAGLFDR